MKRCITALGLALLLAFSLTALPVSAAGRPWEEAYLSFMRENNDEYLDWGCDVLLIDLNQDGIPELLLGSYGARGRSFATSGASYRNGTLHTLSFDEWGDSLELRDDIELYQNKTTGERKIEALYDMPYSTGFTGGLCSVWHDSSYTLRSATVFEESVDFVNPAESEYYINGQRVSESKYNTAYDNRNNGWSKVSDFQVVCDRLSNGLSEAADAEIMSIFSQWKDPTPPQPAGKTASPTSHSMTVNGVPVSPAAYNIDGNNYFKLRDIAALLTGTEARFQVGYDQQTRAITLTTGQAYTAVGGELAALPPGAQKVIPTPSAVYVDGKQVSFTAYNINGNNYFKLRDLGEALGFQVGWDGSTRTMIVETR